MKRKVLFTLLIVLSFDLIAQNTFPASGNVGIGTTSPSKELEIRGNDGVGLRLFNQVSNTWDIINSQYGKLDFIRGGSNIMMRIDQYGKVGIGTLSPTEKLTLGSTLLDGYTSLLSLKELNNNGRNSMGIDWYFGGSAGFPWGSSGRIEVARQNTSASFDLAFHSSENGTLSEKMRIMASGMLELGRLTQRLS